MKKTFIFGLGLLSTIIFAQEANNLVFNKAINIQSDNNAITVPPSKVWKLTTCSPREMVQSGGTSVFYQNVTVNNISVYFSYGPTTSPITQYQPVIWANGGDMVKIDGKGCSGIEFTVVPIIR